MAERRVKHFAREEWIDFVNQTLPAARQTEMQGHLDDGCEHCAKAAGLWQRVRQAARAERNYQPPAGIVRAVKAAFVASREAGKEKGRSRVELLFDSFLQPAPAGARSSGAGERQLSYRAEPYQIDVQIEATPHDSRLVVTGQLLDLSNANTVGRGILVELSNGRGNVVRTVTNEFGEFSGVLEDSDDLQIAFTGENYKPTIISLRDAVGRRSRGAR